MDEDSDEGLTAEIMRALEIDHQFVRWLDAGSHDAIAQVRSRGRKAGRALGYKIRTFVTDQAQREDGQVAVFVVAIAATDEDQARIAERSRMLITHAMNHLLG